MNDLAKQAFDTNNFDLSAEIWERSLIENGPQVDRYLRLGDSYARGGHLKKAFEAYSYAYKLGANKPDLSHLVTGLVDIMSSKDEAENTHKQSENEDIFTCAICRSMWTDPIILRCGHTFCKSCLEKEETKICKVCKVSYHHVKLNSLNPCVLLSQVVEKWFPHELEAVKLKSIGNGHFKEANFKDAVRYYSEAFQHAPEDHLLASNRSYAFAALHRYEEALMDANLAIQLRPDWPKGFFRKGAALAGLGRTEESAYAFLQCLTLDQNVTSARNELANALHKMLSPTAAPEDLQQAKMALTTLAASSGVVASEKDDPSGPLSNHSTKGLKDSLPSFLEQPGPSIANVGTSTSTVNFLFNPQPLTKSNSFPSFSPLMPPKFQDSRKKATSQEDLPQECVPRKRSFGAESPMEPQSPTRSSTPSKQPRCSDEQIAQSTDRRHVPQELLDKDDFECSLCMRLLYRPVTTPCGHSFCRQCLDRVMDHTPQCPLCKGTLVEYLADRQAKSVTESLEKILLKYFSNDVEERKKQYEEEMAEFARIDSEDKREVPIFVCTLAFPQLPCPLHVFEPRYRLMIRQCMESGTRQFGMCMLMEGNDEANFCDHGTMLEIRDVQYFPDGRSVVDCMGGRRFKVLSKSTRDGYNTATVEFLTDKRPENEQELADVHQQLHSEARAWFGSIPGMPRQQIIRHFGDFPDVEHNPIHLPNGPTWHWWLCAILPLDPRAQLSILGMGSLKDRLKALQRVLNFVKRQSMAK